MKLAKNRAQLQIIPATPSEGYSAVKTARHHVSRQAIEKADGGVAFASVLTATLSCDHRVIDGARAALFLKDLANAVTEPEKWLE